MFFRLYASGYTLQAIRSKLRRQTMGSTLSKLRSPDHASNLTTLADSTPGALPLQPARKTTIVQPDTDAARQAGHTWRVASFFASAPTPVMPLHSNGRVLYFEAIPGCSLSFLDVAIHQCSRPTGLEIDGSCEYRAVTRMREARLSPADAMVPNSHRLRFRPRAYARGPWRGGGGLSIQPPACRRAHVPGTTPGIRKYSYNRGACAPYSTRTGAQSPAADLRQCRRCNGQSITEGHL